MNWKILPLLVILLPPTPLVPVSPLPQAPCEVDPGVVVHLHLTYAHWKKKPTENKEMLNYVNIFLTKIFYFVIAHFLENLPKIIITLLN